MSTPTNRATNSLTGPFIDFLRGADLFEVALRKNDDAVGHFHRFLLIVGDEYGCQTDFVVEAHEPLAQFLADLGIDGGEWFVKQKDIGFGREGAGDGDALPLAAGKLMRVALQESLQFQQRGQFRHTRLIWLAVPFFDLQTESDVSGDGHVAEERVILEDKPDVALADGDIVDLRAANENATAFGCFQSGDEAEDGGFAAAAGTRERD